MAAPAPPLDRAQKAAIVVHLLLSEGADPGVADLPPAAQRRLAHALGSLRGLDRAALRDVVAEFAAELDAAGLRMPRDLPEALRALDGRLSPDVLADLAAQSGARGLGAGAWRALDGLADEALSALLAAETPEVSAVVLSQLPPGRAARLLAEAGPDRGGDVAAAFARTAAIGPDAVSAIALSLGRAAGARPPAGLPDAPEARVGAILNAATTATRGALLDRLEAEAPDFAARVRGAVFSWEDVPTRLDPRDVPRVLRDVDDGALLAALGAEPDGPVATFLMGAISKRLAEQMRGQIEEAGPVAPDDAEAGRSAVAAAIRALDDAGTLSLLAPDEDAPTDPA